MTDRLAYAPSFDPLETGISQAYLWCADQVHFSRKQGLPVYRLSRSESGELLAEFWREMPNPTPKPAWDKARASGPDDISIRFGYDVGMRK